MSQLRITGGTARGRVLKGAVADGIRPTSSRVREALFSMVGQDLAGVRFLDGYAGSGLVGFEAWSRGAEVVAVELKRSHVQDIQGRARDLGMSERFTARAGDLSQGVADPFGIIFVDPPYDLDPGPVLEKLAPSAGEWLIAETRDDRELAEAYGPCVLDRYRDYGESRLWLYARSGG